MATLHLKIEIDGWTVEQLKQAVRDLDALEDEVPIAIDQVKAWDVISAIVTGQLGVNASLRVDKMED